jgi:hypothetical protein
VTEIERLTDDERRTMFTGGHYAASSTTTAKAIRIIDAQAATLAAADARIAEQAEQYVDLQADLSEVRLSRVEALKERDAAEARIAELTEAVNIQGRVSVAAAIECAELRRRIQAAVEMFSTPWHVGI